MVVAFGQPASVSKVVAVIRKSSGGISQKELIATTGLSERSVKYALKALKFSGLIYELAIARDMRRKTYRMEG